MVRQMLGRDSTVGDTSLEEGKSAVLAVVDTGS